jgi:RimJ/RimL family protein N-acetyltransferase
MVTVSLRETTDDDLPILFAFQAEPEGSAMAAYPSRDREAFDAVQAKIRSDPSMLQRTIESESEVVGSVGAWDDQDGRMLGYWIGQAHWRRGIATAAVAAFLEIETTRPLVAIVAQHNIGSRHVLERNGFSLTSTSAADDGVVELLFELR